jgi:hypothetical protein
MDNLDFSILSEREALCGFLDLQRAALVQKVEGVSDSDARSTPTVSSLSLLGLLKHSALWERRWFQVVVAGRTFPGEWPESGRAAWRTDDFVVAEGDTVGHWVACYEDQVAMSRKITASAELDAPCARQDPAHAERPATPAAGHRRALAKTDREHSSRGQPVGGRLTRQRYQMPAATGTGPAELTSWRLDDLDLVAFIVSRRISLPYPQK